ncbi:uncharacterized protein ATNIH1004_009480 [Aspergillus tanneri]|uniref:Enoyl reductase (ER) domain-containing protein n=1 Tax=Aspergillus tanneri TaxID=1220188 RepID=A0A5M9M7F0_9EURO|nr:uncharacterized protein ATNIH1004_009480 [Aspergillus tanneri]KAA8642728.1 hypothetical protein ATNIH1004_009480 [Aspergillus tanneri]
MFPAPEDNVVRTYLFDKFERLGTLTLAEIYYRYAHNVDLADAPQHIQHFAGWVRRRMGDSTRWFEEVRRLRSSERLEILEEIFGEVDFCSDGRICRYLFYNIDDVFYCHETGLKVVVEDGRLHALFADSVILTGAYPQLQRCSDCLGHANPSLNILEIGSVHSWTSRDGTRPSTQGLPSHVAHFDEASLPPNSRAIVYLGDGEPPINMDEHRLKQMQRMVRNISSVVWITSCGLIQGLLLDQSTGAELQRPGSTTHAEMDNPLRDDCVEVKVTALKLNWKDMAVSACLNRLTRPGLWIRARSSSWQLSPRACCIRSVLADGDNFGQMASMPQVYMTAIYVFEHVTQVRRGEKVLVQSATWGLGLCAMQLARSMGVEIFCTVGTPDKTLYFTEKMGISCFPNILVSKLRGYSAFDGGHW